MEMVDVEALMRRLFEGAMTVELTFYGNLWNVARYTSLGVESTEGDTLEEVVAKAEELWPAKAD
jgi:hypothetical protein